MCFNDKERNTDYKNYNEGIMKEGNYVEVDAVEGPIVCVGREEVASSLNEMKTGKVPEPSDVSMELITSSFD